MKNKDKCYEENYKIDMILIISYTVMLLISAIVILSQIKY